MYYWRAELLALQEVSLMEDKLRASGVDAGWREVVNPLSRVKAVHIRFADDTAG